MGKVFLKRIFHVLFFVCTFSFSLIGQDSYLELNESPFIQSSWNGGIMTDRDLAINYQNINFKCNTFGVSYKQRLEAYVSVLFHNESSADNPYYSFLLRYKQPLGRNAFISANVLGLEESPGLQKLSFGGYLKQIRLNPGITFGVETNNRGFGLSFSYYRITNDHNKYYEWFAFDEIKDYLMSAQLFVFLIPQLRFNAEWNKYSTFNVNNYNRFVDQSELFAGFSYSFFNRFSIDLSYWIRLNNREKKCEIACLNGFPRIGVSVKIN